MLGSRVNSIIFLIATSFLFADDDSITVEQRLYDLEHKVNIIDNQQINYKIEKNLLKETYSINYSRINNTITIILSVITVFLSVLGFLGLRSIFTIKGEYKSELEQLKSLKNKFDEQIEAGNTKIELLNGKISELSNENISQNTKINLIELRDKAKYYFKNDEYESSLAFADEGLKIDESDYTCLMIKARSLVRLNRFQESLNVNLKLSELEKSSSQLLNLIEAYLFNKNIDKAKEIINTNPNLFLKEENKIIKEYFEIIICYIKNDQDQLESYAISYVDDNNKSKVKKRIDEENWELKEAHYFVHYEEDTQIKEVLYNLLLFWDGQITGMELLEELNLDYQN